MGQGYKMKALTAGHLTNNAGLRGHSVGDYYPWRVMATGCIDDLSWWVVRPDGARFKLTFTTASQAVTMARLLHSLN